MSSSPRTVDLGHLLGVCVAAAHAACETITQLNAARRSGTAGAFVLEDKEADDPKSALTIVDLAAQNTILRVLKPAFPDIPIVAEEDQTEEAPPAGVEYAFSPPAPEYVPVPEALRALPLHECCVFIDPLDGTKEFVDNHLHNVMSLIGISHLGVPVAGVIAAPFRSRVVYGAVGGAVSGLIPPPPPPTPSLRVLTSVSTHPAVTAARTALFAHLGDRAVAVETGGCGAKFLRMLDGGADVSLQSLGTSLWDTCGPAALLVAVGGRVTDMRGDDIVHAEGARIKNRAGVVATVKGVAHEEVLEVIEKAGVLDLLKDRE